MNKYEILFGIMIMIGVVGANTVNINVSSLNSTQWNALKSITQVNTLNCSGSAIINYIYNNQSFSLQYNVKACPNPINNVSVDVGSAYVNQTEKLFINNTNINVKVAGLKQVNKVINLTSPYSFYRNDTINLTVRDILNKSVLKYNSSINQQNYTYNNLNLSVGIKPLRINKRIILGFNQSYYNSSLNFSAITPTISMFEQANVNYTDLYSWYNSTYNNNCASSIIINNGSFISENVISGNSSYVANVPLEWHLCAQVKGQNKTNIGDICSGYDIFSKNLSTSLGQCVIGIHNMDMQNLSIIQNEYYSAENTINSQSRVIQNQSIIITQGTDLGAGLFQIVLVVVASGVIGLGVLIYLEIKKRNSIRIR